MEIPKFIKGVAKYFTYASDSGETTPTTQADLQELMKNNNAILECLVDDLWQPGKQMNLNQIIRSPNMPANTVAKVTAVGTTGKTEPEWPQTVDATVSDGSVTFTMLTNVIVSYTKTETDAKLEDKADLVDGKVPTNQLPEMDYVPKVGDTEIEGILTATNFKTNNTPLNAVDVCNKKYVDEEISNIDFPSAAPLPTNTDGVGKWTVVSTTLPNGGMWAYFGFYTDSGGGVNGNAHYAGIAAGGTTVSSGSWRHTFCWRIS